MLRAEPGRESGIRGRCSRRAGREGRSGAGRGSGAGAQVSAGGDPGGTRCPRPRTERAAAAAPARPAAILHLLSPRASPRPPPPAPPLQRAGSPSPSSLCPIISLPPSGPPRPARPAIPPALQLPSPTPAPNFTLPRVPAPLRPVLSPPLFTASPPPSPPAPLPVPSVPRPLRSPGSAPGASPPHPFNLFAPEGSPCRSLRVTHPRPPTQSAPRLSRGRPLLLAPLPGTLALCSCTPHPRAVPLGRLQIPFPPTSLPAAARGGRKDARTRLCTALRVGLQ